MARPLRNIEPGVTCEITSRTIEGRLLLLPSNELNDIVNGILGKAMQLYPLMLLHAFVTMSNHLQMLVTPPDGATLAKFMCYVNSNLAREAGRINRWKSRFWGRRYTCVPVLDPEAQVHRMRYIMAHGAKEGLVYDPEQWPGATSLPALLHGEKIVGTWYDRTKAYRLGAHGSKVPKSEYAETVEVPISPLPCWQHLTPEEYRQRCNELMEDIREELKKMFRRTGVEPMGPRRIRRMDPHSKPRDFKKTPAPRCHCSRRDLRAQYKVTYRRFVEAFRAASARYRAGDHTVEFPPNSFPPSRAFVAPLPDTG